MNDEEIDSILKSIGDVRDIEIDADEIEKILRENDFGGPTLSSNSLSRHIKAEEILPNFLRDSFETPIKKPSISNNDHKDSINYDQELINQILADLDEEKKPKNEIKRNPLDEIDEKARKILDLESYESKFAITCPSQGSNHSNIVYEDLDQISRKIYPKSRSPDGTIGIPRCISTLPNKHIAVGTSYALIALFNYDQRNFRVLGGAKEQNYGPVSALHISEDECMLSGYENGYIAMWDLKNDYQFKLISNLHNCPITAFSFYNGVWNDFVSGDNFGHMFIVKISKVFLSYTIDRQCLIKGDGNGISSVMKMPDSYCKDHFLVAKSKVLSICSFNRVFVIMIEPAVRVLLKIEKPSYIRDGVLPWISFGAGDLPDKKSENPLMALSWGEKIDIYEFPNVDYLDSKHAPPELYSHFITNHEILIADFIAPSLIFLMNSRKELKILFTAKFHKGKYESQTFIPDDFQSAVVNSQIVDPDMLYQTHLRDSQKRVRSSYNNTVNVSLKSHSVILLSFNGLYKGKIWEWSKYLTELSERGEWVNSLQLGYEMYSGKNSVFFGLPSQEKERKNKMRDFLKSFCQKYLNQLCSSLSSSSLWNSYITVLMDFCLGIDCFEFLFIDVLKVLKIQGVGRIFMENLEPFVLANRIKSIPDNLFRDLVYFYKSEAKIDVIQRLIINLDVRTIDPGNVIPLCLENNLYTALIFICTKMDADFITPLVKLYTRLRELESKGDSDKEVQEYGYKILWYVRLTLTGHYFPEGLIDENTWPQVIKQLAVWIFANENLFFFIEIDPNYSYDILLLFFAGAAASNIEPDPDFLAFFGLEANPKMSSANLIRDSMLKRIIDVQNKLEGKKEKGQFIIFLANIVTLNTFHIDKSLCLSNVRYILSEESHNKKMETISLNLINACSDQLTSDEIDDLIESSLLSPFNEFIAKLYFLKGENVKALKSLLENPQKEIRVKVFNYLNETLVTDSKSTFEELWDFILQNIKELVSLNPEATQELIQKHNRSLEKKAVVALSQWPSLQLDFLEKILEERKNGQIIENELLILHVSLLCRLNPGKVIWP